MARDELARLGGPEQAQQMLASLTACVNSDTLLQLARGFATQYRHLASESTEHFLATQVVALPTGDEAGAFVAIDLGGTNLRVEFVELLGDADLPSATKAAPNGSHAVPTTKVRRTSQKAWPIEAHLKYDMAEDLFAWIGDCIAEVLEDAIAGGRCKVSGDDQIPIGVTFSFPMTQTSLSEATLMPMGKGFAITSDLNLGKMLLAGYARHCSPTNGDVNGNGDGTEPPSTKRRKLAKLPRIRIAAITNDTVATYVSSAYTIKSQPASRTAMGLIVGTGCNATIPMWLSDLHAEKQGFVSLLPGQDAKSTKIVVNTEWTIRGTDIPMRKLGITTDWDDLLGSETERPGFQPFEYMTGGRYLGELVRLILVDVLRNTNQAETLKLPDGLLKKDAITTEFIATKVTGNDEGPIREELERRFHGSSTDGKPFWTVDRVKLMQDITEAVQVRASVLIAAAVVGLLACVGELKLDLPNGNGNETNGVNGHSSPSSNEPEELVVAYTGSMIEKYPGFLDSCQRWIDDLSTLGSKDNKSKRVVLREATDGGVIGAAVLAGVALSRVG